MKTFFLAFAILAFSGCSKQCVKDVSAPSGEATISPTAANGKAPKPVTNTFTRYTIQAGAHECDQRAVKSVSGTSMNFTVKFDSTAIYPAVITDYNHAYDVNKLWGFSEGLSNQYNSARIGWRWLNDRLELLAYVYIRGTLLRDPVSYDPPLIKTVAIGSEVTCSIAVSGSNYIFTVDGTVVSTPRGTTSSRYSGYQQYPYFGGNLTAPHLINIFIK